MPDMMMAIIVEVEAKQVAGQAAGEASAAEGSLSRTQVVVVVALAESGDEVAEATPTKGGAGGPIEEGELVEAT